MKIGVFDSGLGGLLLLKSIAKKLPEYDYIYLGDTKRVPYGDRSQETIYQFTREAVEYLFKQNCKLVILACNTASSRALRRMQREYLPKHYPDRKVLGVIIPTAEAVVDQKGIDRVGVLATKATVNSRSYVKELQKLNKKIQVVQQAAPLVVPIIENNGLRLITSILEGYIKPLQKKKVKAILLGCTHYSIIKTPVRKMVGANVKAVSQDEIIPLKLKSYLKQHPEIEKKLAKRGKVDLRVTDLTAHYIELAKQWFGKVKLRKVKLNQ